MLKFGVATALVCVAASSALAGDPKFEYGKAEEVAKVKGTEYTATAFSKPLMMVFHAVYRPTRQVETLVEGSSYFTQEVRYRAEMEPILERHVYGPLLRAVLRVANGMKVLQAGSLHAYLAYVLVLTVILLMWLGGTT